MKDIWIEFKGAFVIKNVEDEEEAQKIFKTIMDNCNCWHDDIKLAWIESIDIRELG